MAAKAVITPFEVVKYSPAGRDYPTGEIARLIVPVEQEIGYDCLGETLYEWMLANLNQWSSDVQEWCEGEAYNEGDLVVRCDMLFKSLEDLNNSNPVDVENSEWEEVKRFGDSDCANELWEDHLRHIIALNVYMRSINTTTLTTGANGLTVLAGAGAYDGQGFLSAKKAEIDHYKTTIIAEIQTRKTAMERWAKKKVLSTCDAPISTMPACSPGVCGPQSAQRRRWGFRY